MIKRWFVLVIDRTRTLGEVIAAGNYSYANPDINSKSCPAVRAETIGDATLVQFDEELTTDEYLAKLDGLGYRAADTFELSAFGESYPDEQRKYPILGLGQDVRSLYDDVCVAYLSGWEGRRRLGLTLRDSRWTQACCVLAFRK